MVQEAVEPKVETLVAEGNPPQPETEAATPSAEERLASREAEFTQLQEELGRERAERAKEAQGRKSAEGRLNTADRRRIIAAERTASRTLSDEDREAVKVETEAALKAADEEQRVETEIATGRQVLEDFAGDMGKKFDADPLFAEVRDLYSKGYYLSATSRMRGVMKAEEAATKQAERDTAEASRRRTREGLETATPRPAAASVNVTTDNIDALWLAGKVKDEVYRAFRRTGEL